MPHSLPVVDPVFAEIAKAIYGDIDPRELMKSMPGPSDVHIDGSMTPVQRAKREKKLALTGLGGTTVATVGAVHALSASRHEHTQAMANAGSEPHKAKLAAQHAKSEAKRAVRLKRVEGLKGPVGHVARAIVRNPKKAALAAGAGWAGLHGVELGADVLNARAQIKEIKRANATIKGKGKKPVSKAFRLRPLNALNNRVPSLRAKRPKLTPLPANPRTQAGLYQPVRKRETTPHAEPYAGTRYGESADVTWTGLIAKVDTDQRQVFGWASVSAINGEPVVDLQGDIVPIEEMEKSAYRYVIESRKGGDMHKRVAKADQPLHTADMIESFVVTPEKLEKMGLPSDALPHGWWVGYHVNDDDQWALVKSGGRKGFSIHGSGRRTAVVKGLPKFLKPKHVIRHQRADSWAPGDPDHLEVRAYEKKLLRRPQQVGWTRVEPDNSIGNIHVNEKHRRKGLATRMVTHAEKVTGQPIVHSKFRSSAGDAFAHGMEAKRGRKVTPLAKADKEKVGLLDRVEQAISPPAVRLHAVKSVAVRAMGYQPQTRRLAVEMHSRPDEPYQYRMKRGAAQDALDAPSKGHHYAKKIRGKEKRAKHYTLVDRARLFFNPDVSKRLVLVSKADPPEAAGVLRAVGTHHAKQARSRSKKAGAAAAVGTAGAGTAAYARHRENAAKKAVWPVSEDKVRAPAARRAAQLRRVGRIGGIAVALGGTGAAVHHITRASAHASRSRQLQRRAYAAERPDYVVKSAASHGGPPTDRLPGDNRNAQRARTRRTTGLGTAGIGYLMATRGQEIAPEAAGLVTRSAKKIGEEEHARRIKVRSGHISRASGKTGAALVGAGLLLAGEGAVSDLRNRGTVGRIRRETAAQIRQKIKD